jgi:hypothetical protein
MTGTLVVSMGLGCPANLEPSEQGEANTIDATNKGASYIGSAACSACHPDYAAIHNVHGHSQKLKKLNGGPPDYPLQGTRAGVPNPPDGSEWADITYVIGGYMRKARFINSQGFVMTNGVDGVNTQWNLDFPPNGTVAGFASYAPGQTEPKPYDYNCFKCHTTGPSQTGHQDSLEGIQGTFAEPAVQCEACHGPGSNHVPNPPGNIYINPASAFCGACHSRGADMNVIPANGGFIEHHEQYQELLASPHAEIRCTTCHDPHTSTVYDRDNAIINSCQACHAGQTMAKHEGKVFTRGDYVEPLSCESCHMPYATKSAAAATEDVIGAKGARMGDVRTHIFYIQRLMVDFNAMFTADGKSVKKDSNGKAAVTLDFVCLRCHNGKGSAFALSLRPPGDTPPTMLKMH